MRLHISLDADLVEALDRRVGARERSAYIGAAVREALDSDERWELIESGFGSITDEGHDWDADPAAWVSQQRRADPDRVG